ncbi:nucleotidyltransferase domain-containing protein [Bacillus sp. CGMCC 1.16607]|uniref:nucleotidyltransferase domain-containing protein n=1 Tax=Bacillus sp. CGMCC 1.16607 TaxID=3351842 RepID=UPI00362AAC79
MKEHILEILKQIEVDYQVKILYACESGSRAWGFPSKDSDYDVRFIYVHQRDWYLSIDDNQRDVLEIPKHDSISIPIHELLDVSGWELTKTLKLFRKSNPPLLEWLNSSIIYYQEFSTVDKMRTIASNIFTPNSCLHHYFNMAKRNYRDYIQGYEVKIKKYFYVLRPILAAKWIEKYESIPPIEFHKLLENIITDDILKESIQNLLSRKMAGEELELEPKIVEINEYLNNEIEHLELYAKNLTININNPTELLNQLFRATLEEVWT